MSLIDDVLDRLQGSKIFTAPDMMNGFFHVPIDEESRKFTAFVTHNGQFEFTHVPFGVSNSPPVFYRYVTATIRDLIQAQTIVVYMNNIIVPSKNEYEGLKALKRLWRRFNAERPGGSAVSFCRVHEG